MKRIPKTILILAICAWTGNGTSLLNASNSHRITRAELEMQQRRPPHDRPPHRGHIMSDSNFQYLYKTIKKKHFEKDRLKVLDIMARHIVDLDNARLILDSFRFESDRRKAANMLGLRRR